jgi:FXSXX-COOH protein
MIATMTVSSLADLRDVPLAELSGMSTGLIEETIKRILPETALTTPVPVAAFQSAI